MLEMMQYFIRSENTSVIYFDCEISKLRDVTKDLPEPEEE